MTVQEACKAIRAATGLTLQKFSDVVGVTLGTVQRWELGTTEPQLPQVVALVQVAQKHGLVEPAKVLLEPLRDIGGALMYETIFCLWEDIFTVRNKLGGLVDDARRKQKSVDQRELGKLVDKLSDVEERLKALSGFSGLAWGSDGN